MRATAIALLVLSFATVARAESFFGDAFRGPACGYGSPPIDPPAGSIPANWPSFQITMYGVDRSTTRMMRVSDGHVVPLRFSPRSAQIQFAPMEPLVAGETYLVDHPICSVTPPRTTMYDITDAVPAPTSVGTVLVHGPFASNTRRGACHRHYFVDIELVPDPAYANAPWSSFQWGTGIDGQELRFAQPFGVHQRVGLDCGGNESWIDPTLAEGEHAFVAATFQPSAYDLTVMQSASASLDMRCADAMRVDDPTLRPIGPVEAMYWDTDVDGSCTDAGSDLDASMDGGARSFDGSPHTEPDTHPNCGCVVSSRRASFWPFALLALLVVRRASR